MIVNNAPYIALDIKPRQLVTGKEIKIDDSIPFSPCLANTPNWVAINNVKLGELNTTSRIGTA